MLFFYYTIAYYNIKVNLLSDEFVLEQFTGLRDKNGVELDWWEGDLLSSPNGIIWEIYWDASWGQWWCQMVNTSISEPFPLQEMADNHYMKVIGNCHQNPELLEEKP